MVLPLAAMFALIVTPAAALCRVETDVRYADFGWLSNNNPHVNNEGACCAACELNPGCTVYQWAAGQCRLGDSYGQRTPSVGFHTGFPDVPAAPTTAFPGPDPCLSQPCYNGGSCASAGPTYTCTCPGNFTGARCDYVLECHPGQVDLFFVMDSSGSIGADNFVKGLNFIVSLVNQARIAHGYSQVGMLQFNDYYYMQFYLNTYKTKANITKAILNSRYHGGGTDIANGMAAALQDGFTSSRGDRADYPDIMVVITDGRDTSNVAKQQRYAAARNITVIAVGIGDQIDEQELIAATGSISRVYTTNSFTNLTQIVNNVCTAIQVVHPCGSSPCQHSGTCVESGSDFSCHCPPGYDGKLCQHADPCFQHPCLHGGSCVEFGQFSYTCACPQPYSGRNCQTSWAHQYSSRIDVWLS